VDPSSMTWTKIVFLFFVFVLCRSRGAFPLPKVSFRVRFSQPKCLLHKTRSWCRPPQIHPRLTLFSLSWPPPSQSGLYCPLELLFWSSRRWDPPYCFQLYGLSDASSALFSFLVVPSTPCGFPTSPPLPPLSCPKDSPLRPQCNVRSWGRFNRPTPFSAPQKGQF